MSTKNYLVSVIYASYEHVYNAVNDVADELLGSLMFVCYCMDGLASHKLNKYLSIAFKKVLIIIDTHALLLFAYLIFRLTIQLSVSPVTGIGSK
jgi:hypothetical protein